MPIAASLLLRETVSLLIGSRMLRIMMARTAPSRSSGTEQKFDCPSLPKGRFADRRATNGTGFACDLRDLRIDP
jgi:hypothetical protein